MNFRTLKVCGVLGAALLPVVGLLLALSPAVAQVPVAQGVLLEVLESPPPEAAPGGPEMPGTFPPGIGGRLAEAKLVGALQGLDLLSGQVELHAQSRVPFDPATGFGVGTITGVFDIEKASGGTVVGKLEGSLDFRFFNSKVPLAPASGTWNTLGKKEDRTSGTFVAIALVPFQIPGLPGWFYLELGADGNPTGGVTPLTADQFNQHGDAVAKFLFNLFQ